MRSLCDMAIDFNSTICKRWLDSQPTDIQDFLNSHAKIEHLGQQISLVFDSFEAAKAGQCLSARLAQPPGLPSLSVIFAYGPQRVSLPQG
jgi:hypothetical protein